MAEIAQIVAIMTRQQPQPPPLPPREVLEDPRRSIERAQKLGAKPYDGNGNPEVAWLWLDRVNKIYRVMGCTYDQRVLFSSFMMEDMAKDWRDAVDRRYPDGMSWDQFQQEFTDRLFPQSHKDLKIEEFFRLEQKNMSVLEYEKRFSEQVRLVPYIQVDTLRVEKSTTAMYQSRQESKRSALSTSQQSSGQSNRKRSNGRCYRGCGASRGTASSQGSVRRPAASSDT